MHAVSPVRVRSHVKSPITADCYDDYFGKRARSKKRVKIGPSTIFHCEATTTIAGPKLSQSTKFINRTTDIKSSITIGKSRSLSPKDRFHWCPPPAKTTRSRGRPGSAKPNPPPQSQLNKRNRSSEYDHIPVRDLPSLRSDERLQHLKAESSGRAPSCSVCSDRRSRSQSLERTPSPHPGQADANQMNTGGFYSSISSNSSLGSSISLNERGYSPNSRRLAKNGRRPVVRRHSLSPKRRSTSRINNNGCSNETFTLPYNRSRSCDSSIKESLQSRSPRCRANSGSRRSASSVLANNRERLVEKLYETESFATDIAQHVSLLKEFICREIVNRPIDSVCPVVLNRLEKDGLFLIQKVEIYEQCNRELKDIIYDLTSPDSMDLYREYQTSAALAKQIDCLELENNNYKKMLMELEKSVTKTGTTNEVLNLENNALANIKSTLEDNRAHLRRQLVAKEAEVNRLNVQIRNLNQKLDRFQVEIDLLRESRERNGMLPLRSSSSSQPVDLVDGTMSSCVNSRSGKLNKTYFNIDEILSDPYKTRLYVEKLKNQMREKDNTIKNLRSGKRSLYEFDRDTKSDRVEFCNAEKLRKENEALKRRVFVKDEQLSSAYNRLKILEKKLQKFTNSSYKKLFSGSLPKPLASDSADDVISSLGQTHSAHHNSNNNNNNNNNNQGGTDSDSTAHVDELNSVKFKLQQRLNEIDSLPELLSNAELKLRDTKEKLKEYQAVNANQSKLIIDLRCELETERNKNLMNKLRSEQGGGNPSMMSSASVSGLTDPNPQPSYRPTDLLSDKKGRISEEESRELQKQLQFKEEQIRDLKNRLTLKANEAATYQRQLEHALSDANNKDQLLKDKFNQKERSLISKVADLEAKLSTYQLNTNSNLRNKDEVVLELKTQIKDLKSRLDIALDTNKRMQDYVNYLKNYYLTYFSDTTLQVQTPPFFTDNGAATHFNFMS